MHKYRISLDWKRTTRDFTYETYDREHSIRFGGGVEILASSAPEFLGKAVLINPEEMLAASLSSCHMLTFLAIAAKSRLIVNAYQDAAVAEMAKNEAGKLAVTKVTLRPRVSFGGNEPVTVEKLKQLHHKAHENCFIALAVKCDVAIEPVT